MGDYKGIYKDAPYSSWGICKYDPYSPCEMCGKCKSDFDCEDDIIRRKNAKQKYREDSAEYFSEVYK